MNENTINERKKADIGTGVQMSKCLYMYHNSSASQGNKIIQVSKRGLGERFGAACVYAITSLLYM